MARGAIGVKLLAQPPRRRSAARSRSPSWRPRHGLPILHHIWQHRTREWPIQEISDGARPRAARGAASRRRRSSSRTSAAAATRRTRFAAVRDMPNIYPDLSGSGVDRGMLDAALAALGARRVCSGRATSRWRPASPSSARSRSSACRATTWRTSAGGTRRGSSRRWQRSRQRCDADGTDRRSRSPDPAMIDFNALIGPYPFRHLPHPDPDVLGARARARGARAARGSGICRRRSIAIPSPGNAALFAALAPHADRAASPCPAFGPTGRSWERALRDRRRRGAPAIRAYPLHWGMGPHDPRCARSRSPAGERGIALVLTVRFEDLRQRHSLDRRRRPQRGARFARSRARRPRTRSSSRAAGREMIEEVHWGLTPDEQRARVLGHLVDLGSAGGSSGEAVSHDRSPRFVYGTHWPLRLTQTPRANLDLLPDDLRRASSLADRGLDVRERYDTDSTCRSS